MINSSFWLLIKDYGMNNEQLLIEITLPGFP